MGILRSKFVAYLYDRLPAWGMHEWSLIESSPDGPMDSAMATFRKWSLVLRFGKDRGVHELQLAAWHGYMPESYINWDIVLVGLGLSPVDKDVFLLAGRHGLNSRGSFDSVVPLVIANEKALQTAFQHDNYQHTCDLANAALRAYLHVRRFMPSMLGPEDLQSP